ncbi:L-Ala-D/L-Glu epimerase [Corynebacterium ciconiae DSM 44920]|uniref:o-succinylbenzoate synthase n=1 Tax=Corynebacterium ciconiae TaxID=227319 RepID=UPI0003760CA8|nr:o-succinylbenzoate synthase [Corynebacterium ciconiae]WKD60271.1 L-Ala-D/L-Glu epimerase [Corynebacterium ciconiae DSM 44920]
MSSLDEVLERTRVVALPMRVKFRGVTVREAALIEGPLGWGEFSAFTEYSPAEASRWLLSGLEAAFLGLPTPPRSHIPVNGTIPAVGPEQLPEVLQRFRACSVLKVKVAEPSQSLADDYERIAAIRQLRPDATLRVDANRGWSVNEAIAAARLLGPLEYMEQPVATVEEMEQLRRWVDVPIAADEAIRKAEDPYEIARRRAADYAVIKVAPMGGVAQVEKVAEFMARYGMGVTIASALDTAVGMNAGVVAAACVAPERAAGLATSQLFVEDVAPPREIVDGMISTAAVAPDPARVEELAAPPARRDWWLKRIEQCWLELGL